MFRTALLILSGNAASSLLLLARNLIIARLIPVQDYGIASTFAVVMAVVEMASAFGLQQQIVQSKHGDDPHFQAALQGFQLLRGVVSGVGMFLLAGPLAQFLGIPEVIWAYQILALVPVLNALQHFDIHRLNRQMRFGPLILTGAVPAILALVAVWPLAVYMGDWQVMFWSIIVQTAVGAITSHLVAERPYRVVFDHKIIGESVRFGWPLLANAVLMFLTFQGDKLVVGRLLGMEAMAIFAMGITLTLTPTLVFARSAQNLFLPRLSRAAESPEFPRIATATLETVAFGSLIFTLGVLLVGGPVIELLLGQKYLAIVPLLIWFAIGQAVRMMKVGPALVALALGTTSNAMAANALRVLALPLVWIVAQRSGSMFDLLLVILAGEVAGLILALLLMVRRSPLRLADAVVPQLLTLVTLTATGLWSLYSPADTHPAAWPVWLASGLALVLATATMPSIAGRFRRRARA